MESYDVSIPVTVQIRRGQVVGGYVDFEGAPWANVGLEPNVWNVHDETWDRNLNIEDQAIAALGEALTDFEAKLTELDAQANTDRS